MVRLKVTGNFGRANVKAVHHSPYITCIANGGYFKPGL